MPPPSIISQPSSKRFGSLLLSSRALVMEEKHSCTRKKQPLAWLRYLPISHISILNSSMLIPFYSVEISSSLPKGQPWPQMTGGLDVLMKLRWHSWVWGVLLGGGHWSKSINACLVLSLSSVIQFHMMLTLVYGRLNRMSREKCLAVDFLKLFCHKVLSIKLYF